MPEKGKVDLNSASIDELAELPDIGEERAKMIVQYREENGPFESLDELDDVPGFDDTEIDDLGDELMIGKKE